MRAEDFEYKDDFIHIWIEGIDGDVACPHMKLYEKLTPSKYKRLMICVESYFKLLKEQGIKRAAAIVPEESKKLIASLGFENVSIEGSNISDVMIREL